MGLREQQSVCFDNISLPPQVIFQETLVFLVGMLEGVNFSL